PGFIDPAELATALSDKGKTAVWLRLSSEDQDPATLLLSLIAAARRIHSDIGQGTLSQMRRCPGMLYGWAAHFQSLARELSEGLPVHSAVVLENCHCLNDAQPTLQLLGTHLLSILPNSFTCIIVSQHSIPQQVLPPGAVQRNARELRLDAEAMQEMLGCSQIALPETLIQRAITLTEGRSVLLKSLLAAHSAFGLTIVQHAIERASSVTDLLVHLAR